MPKRSGQIPHSATEQIAKCIIVEVLFQKLDPASQAKWEERLEEHAIVNLVSTWESMASFLEGRL